MNEQIKQIAIKAQVEHCISHVRLQEFAELIVNECANHALTFNNNLQSLNDKEIRSHSGRIIDYIKDRMGLE